MVHLIDSRNWVIQIIKGNILNLIYAIITFVLFLYGCYTIFIKKTGANPLILIPILIISIFLLVVYFINKKKQK